MIQYNIVERPGPYSTHFELEMSATLEFPFCIRTFKEWCRNNIPGAVVNDFGDYWGTSRISVITLNKEDLALLKLTWL